jgi:hypothetical protein
MIASDPQRILRSLSNGRSRTYVRKDNEHEMGTCWSAASIMSSAVAS